MVDTLLRKYENSSVIIRLKTRFLLYLLFVIIIFIPCLVLYTAYIQHNNPAMNYTINWRMLSPEIAVFFLITGTLILLLRGHFLLSAQITTILIFASIWMVIILDRSEITARLDTTMILLAFFSATPILVSRKKYVVLVYGALNLAALYAFTFYFKDTLGLSASALAEYLSDTTAAFLFTAIVAYNILSINNRALDHAVMSTTALQRSNMELQATMEELTASNEEFEAQNEEMARSEESLRASEADLLEIFNSVYDAMIITDLDGTILDVNQRMLEMFRLDRQSALSLKIAELSATPFEMDSLKKVWMETIGGGSSLYEWESKRPGDGSTFITEVGLKTLKRSGKAALLAVVRDISLRKQAEKALNESLQEKIVLIREIHHRVKNNMQVISSLLNMQADLITEPLANQSLKDAVGRIHSMASIHEKIYSTDNFSKVDMSGYIEDLSRDLLVIYSGQDRPVRINHRMDTVYLGIDMAIPCGLLINEILTNSIKHGRREAEETVINLELQETGGMITLVIADNGPGMPSELFESQPKTSMGMQIINALARQIGAEMELSVENGTRFIIRFPAR